MMRCLILTTSIDYKWFSVPTSLGESRQVRVTDTRLVEEESTTVKKKFSSRSCIYVFFYFVPILKDSRFEL